MKQHEMYINSLAQTSKCKGDFMVAALNAKLPFADAQNAAEAMFPPPQPPQHFHAFQNRNA